MSNINTTRFLVAVPKVPLTIDEIRVTFYPMDCVEARLLHDTFEQTPIQITKETLPHILDKIVVEEACPFEILAKNRAIQRHYKHRPASSDVTAYKEWLDKFQVLANNVHKSRVKPWLRLNMGNWLLSYTYRCDTGDCVTCQLEQGMHWENVSHLAYPHY